MKFDIKCDQIVLQSIYDDYRISKIGIRDLRTILKYLIWFEDGVDRLTINKCSDIIHHALTSRYIEFLFKYINGDYDIELAISAVQQTSEKECLKILEGDNVSIYSDKYFLHQEQFSVKINTEEDFVKELCGIYALDCTCGGTTFKEYINKT